MPYKSNNNKKNEVVLATRPDLCIYIYSKTLTYKCTNIKVFRDTSYRSEDFFALRLRARKISLLQTEMTFLMS